jgi:hypothetical protein
MSLCMQFLGLSLSKSLRYYPLPLLDQIPVFFPTRQLSAMKYACCTSEEIFLARYGHLVTVVILYSGNGVSQHKKLITLPRGINHIAAGQM